MKPNSEKAGDLFVTPMMLEQLRYSGLLEVCTIRKMGFPIRRHFEEFMQRYGCISPSATNLDALLQDLVNKVRAKLDRLRAGRRGARALLYRLVPSFTCACCCASPPRPLDECAFSLSTYAVDSYKPIVDATSDCV